MKKLLLAIYLTLMVSTLNGETVKKENVKWIKLKNYYDTDTENIEKGIVYQEVKGKNYKCGEIKNGNPEGKWISWYENGQKKAEGNYVNGNLEGKWIEWYENGQKKYEVTCKDDKFINWTYWKKNGERKDILTTTSTGEKIIRLIDDNTIDKDIKDDEIGGMGYLFLYLMSDIKNATIYQEIKGKDYKCGELKDGEREGKWIKYYESGQKKEEINYVNGNLEGKYISWYENGQKEKERNYREWKEEGIWKSWYENGQKESEVTYKDGRKIKGVYWNKKGKIVGIITKNNAGQRIIKLSGDDAEVLQDVRDGIVYREIKGKDYKCGELKDRKREGKWIEYYENSQKREEGNYLNGNPEGNWKSWYENGNKESEIIVKEGKKVEGTYWNEKGEVIGRITTNSKGKTIVKLLEYNKEIIKNVEDGVVYQKIKGKDYKCGELKDGKEEGNWIEWNKNGEKKSEVTYKDGEEIKRVK